ncbi:uncharacterized protein LOC123266507 [Cotesia glomerata]|uniref:Uncharacterized protein n=1 Tax=Cotesia glomerata TaxID=32391 RepID=A0AAV7HZG6_COTGL|nr:uncharacterized protein LOC123266507 [Cotesia glomerata]KAH0535876.1 hypothetical protein KQX54_019805 [Cotesia glomerata]
MNFCYLGLFVRLSVFAVTFSNALYTYQSQAPKKYVNYLPNPYVSALVTGETSKLGDVFLEFNQKVYREDNFQISVQITDEKGAVITDIIEGINLCDQLDIELMNLRPFSPSNIFGLTGLRCPINFIDHRKLTDILPFHWPEDHYFPVEIGCGVRNYRVTLLKCLGPGLVCQPLIQSRVESNFVSDRCVKQSFLIIDLIMINKSPTALSMKSVSIIDNKLTKVSNYARDNIVGTQVENIDVIDAETNTIVIANDNDNNIKMVDAGVEKFRLIDAKVDKVEVNTDTNSVELIDTNVKSLETSADDVKVISGSDRADNNFGIINSDSEKHSLVDASVNDILLENNKDGGIDVSDNQLETIKRDDEINSTVDLYQDE